MWAFDRWQYAHGDQGWHQVRILNIFIKWNPFLILFMVMAFFFTQYSRSQCWWWGPPLPCRIWISYLDVGVCKFTSLVSASLHSLFIVHSPTALSELLMLMLSQRLLRLLHSQSLGRLLFWTSYRKPNVFLKEVGVDNNYLSKMHPQKRHFLTEDQF